uniref:Zinc-ribbon domain-containing protein n=1 Tax=Manihot esculenta TaxID=3983 RepID=A0A2C9V3X1_MANES
MEYRNKSNNTRTNRKQKIQILQNSKQTSATYDSTNGALAHWARVPMFKRLTGRNDVIVSARDYKFYSPRHKYRRVVSNIPGLPTLPATDNSSTIATAQGFRSPQNEQQTPSKHHVDSLSHQPQFHPIHQNHHQVHQGQHATQFSQNQQCGPSSHLSEITHANQSPGIPQHMAYLQPLTGGHVAGRLHLMPASPAKFCDECGAPYLRETSKFCSECGTKRLGM